MSDIFKLNLQDVTKGILVAVLSAVLSTLYQALTAQAVIDPKQLLIIGLTAGLGYIIKNFFSDSAGKFAGRI